MAAGKRVLVVTGGHRVALDDFLGAIAEICRDRGWVWAHATQPTAQAWLDPTFAGCWDAILLHDIPGLALARGTEPVPLPPGPGVAEALVGLLDSGQGLVVLHHAIAAWPTWAGWAEAIGGRFNYRPARMRGEDLPSSGYRMGTFTVEVADASHPICAGITDFTIDGELYFAPVLTGRVMPFLTQDADMSGELFQDTFDMVTNGSSTGVTCAGHQADAGLHGGHRLMGWTTTAGISPVATLLMGDGPSTFTHPMFRTLLGNALDWVSSADAKNAAAAQPFAVPLP
ncbi:MAG: ThuA domain-containing protein [Actinobacteria bacterium]|nr:ThuA domain-containing protein [Actinomycetota bacterium]